MGSFSGSHSRTVVLGIRGSDFCSLLGKRREGKEMETEAERQRDKETDLTESIIGDFF